MSTGGGLSNSKLGQPTTDFLAVFRNEDVFLPRHLNFTFLCGASHEHGDSFRSQFTKYLSHFPVTGTHQLLCQAEDALEAYHARTSAYVQLADFEECIAEIFDVVLIFPESPGSIAELGYFAGRKKITEKTLVAISSSHQNSSFIYDGVLPIYNEESHFRPVMVLTESSPEYDKVADRSNQYVQAKRHRTRFQRATYRKMTARHQFCLVYELIRGFGGLFSEDVLYLLEKGFRAPKKTSIDYELSIMQASGLIEARGDDPVCFVARDHEQNLLEFDESDILDHHAAVRMEVKKYHGTLWNAQRL